MTTTNEMKPLNYPLPLDIPKMLRELEPNMAYAGIQADNGRNVIVVRNDVGDGLVIKYQNSKGWYECVEYDENGDRLCDFLER